MPEKTQDSSVDYECPVCFELVYQPVTLPCCKNSYCLKCFDLILQKADADACPMCRTRGLRSFARRSRNQLVNVELEKEVKRRFPERYKLRAEGVEIDDEDSLSNAPVIVSAAGEIGKEFLAMQAEYERKRQEEERATLELLKQLKEQGEQVDLGIFAQLLGEDQKSPSTRGAPSTPSSTSTLTNSTTPTRVVTRTVSAPHNMDNNDRNDNSSHAARHPRYIIEPATPPNVRNNRARYNTTDLTSISSGTVAVSNGNLTQHVNPTAVSGKRKAEETLHPTNVDHSGGPAKRTRIEQFFPRQTRTKPQVMKLPERSEMMVKSPLSSPVLSRRSSTMTNQITKPEGLGMVIIERCQGRTAEKENGNSRSMRSGACRCEKYDTAIEDVKPREAKLRAQEQITTPSPVRRRSVRRSPTTGTVQVETL
eukprot:Colp12_sorted_trinity150504_noHs@187